MFLAHDADLQRQVAIKVPINRDGRRGCRSRALLERSAVLARLSHPNIVPVHDVGHTDDGRGFVVSMFVSGGDLAAQAQGSAARRSWNRPGWSPRSATRCITPIPATCSIATSSPPTS